MVQKLVAVLVPVTEDADVANQCEVHLVAAAEVVDVVVDEAVECVDKKLSYEYIQKWDRVRDGMESLFIAT